MSGKIFALFIFNKESIFLHYVNWGYGECKNIDQNKIYPKEISLILLKYTIR